MTTKKSYWLFKSEPNVFSIDDLKKRPKQIEPWNGVRNYQVRNMMRDQIKVGDLAFFYHSSCEPPGIVGIMEIVRGAYPDPTAWDKKSQYYDPKGSPEKPLWLMVDVKFVEKFPCMITLEELKNNSALKEMPVVRRGNRLSITPVTEKEWNVILKLGNGSRIKLQ